MDKRYNYILVNGVKIPSPDSKNRYVPLDIFPSDMLERIEVIKALTPNMEGDAIGGAMNLGSLVQNRISANSQRYQSPHGSAHLAQGFG